MRAYGFGFCVIEGGFIVLIALNWGEGDALRGVLLAWLAVHIFLSLPMTDNVLRQHYIDALQNADQLIVTPEGSNTLIQPK